MLIVLTTTLSFCQTISTNNNSYPKQVIIGQDTVVAITKAQLVAINKDIVKLQKLEQLDSLNTLTLFQKDSIIVELNSLYKQRIEIESVLYQQLQIQQTMLEIQNKKYEDITLSFKKENLQLQKQLRRTNIKSGLIQTGIIVTLILLPVLLLK